MTRSRFAFSSILAMLIVAGASISLVAQLPGPPVGAPQSNQSASIGYNFQYNFTPAAVTGYGFRVNPTLRLTTATGQNDYLFDVAGTINLPNSSTTVTTAAGAHVGTITCTLNSGTVTNCANLVVEAEPSTGTNKYAMWSKGVLRLDSTIVGTYTLSGTPTLTAPTINAYTITGTGTIGNGATLTTPIIAGYTMTGTGTIAAGLTATSTILVTPTLGVWTSTSGTITATTNQLILGTTNLTTLSAASPSGSATVDISTKAGGLASASPCGTTSTCTAVAATANLIVKYGSVALASASPSVVTVGSLPYTSAASYFCTAVPEGTTAAIAAAGVAISKTDGANMVLTGPNTVTTIIDYICYGT